MNTFRWLAIALLCSCNTFSSLDVVPESDLDVGVDVDLGGPDASSDGGLSDATQDAAPDLVSQPEPYEWQGSGRAIKPFAELPRFDDGGRVVEKTAKIRQHLIFAENHAQLVYFRQSDITSMTYLRINGTYEWSAALAFRPPRELVSMQLTDVDTQVYDDRVFRSFSGHDCDANNSDLEIFAWAAEAANVQPAGIVHPSVTCANRERYGFATEFVGGWNPVTETISFPIHYAWFYGGAVEIRPEGFTADNFNVMTGRFSGDLDNDGQIFGNRGPMLFSIYKSEGRVRYGHVLEGTTFSELGLETASRRLSTLFIDGNDDGGTYVLAHRDTASDVQLRRIDCSTTSCTHSAVLDDDGNQVVVPDTGSDVRMLPIRGGFVLLGHVMNRIWWRVYAFGKNYSVNEIPALGSGSQIEVQGDVIDISGVLIPDGNGGADLLIGHRVSAGDSDRMYLRGFRTAMFFGTR